jgi:hypothetical protein
MPIGRLLARFSSVPGYLAQVAKDPQKRISLNVKKISLEELYAALYEKLANSSQ